MLNCTASTGSIQPSCFADVTVVVKRNADGVFPDDIKIMVVTAPTSGDVDQDAKEAWKTISDDVRTFRELKAAYCRTTGRERSGSTKNSRKLNMKALVDLSSSIVQDPLDEADDESCEDCNCEKHKVFFVIIVIGAILAASEYLFGICS